MYYDQNIHMYYDQSTCTYYDRSTCTEKLRTANPAGEASGKAKGLGGRKPPSGVSRKKNHRHLHLFNILKSSSEASDGHLE